MNWFNLIFTCMLATGGFIATSYVAIAEKMALPVGVYFQRNGLMSTIGGYIGLAAVVATLFINPWWTIFIVFLVAIYLCKMLVSIFGMASQLLSLVLMIVGITFLLVKALM